MIGKEIQSFIQPLKALSSLFHKAGCPGMVIGGVAASLLGKPRFTADVDAVILVEDEKLGDLLEKAIRVGLSPRIKDPLEFALKNRVFLLKHKRSGINIDLALGILPFEKEAIARGRDIRIGKLTFRIPCPEDFIVLKAVAHRPIDIEDIKGVIARHPLLSSARVSSNLRAFAKLLDMPEIYEDIIPLLKPARAHGRRKKKSK